MTIRNEVSERKSQRMSVQSAIKDIGIKLDGLNPDEMFALADVSDTGTIDKSEFKKLHKAILSAATAEAEKEVALVKARDTALRRAKMFKWFFFTASMVVFLQVGLNAGLTAATVILSKDLYSESTTLTDGNGTILGVREATERLPLIVAPVLSMETLGAVKAMDINYHHIDPNLKKLGLEEGLMSVLYQRYYELYMTEQGLDFTPVTGRNPTGKVDTPGSGITDCPKGPNCVKAVTDKLLAEVLAAVEKENPSFLPEAEAFYKPHIEYAAQSYDSLDIKKKVSAHIAISRVSKYNTSHVEFIGAEEGWKVVVFNGASYVDTPEGSAQLCSSDVTCSSFKAVADDPDALVQMAYKELEAAGLLLRDGSPLGRRLFHYGGHYRHVPGGLVVSVATAPVRGAWWCVKKVAQGAWWAVSTPVSFVKDKMWEAGR